jgi:hypothetical protein
MPDDGNDGVNPEFDQPEPDEFKDDDVVEEVDDAVEEVDDDVVEEVDDNMSIDAVIGDFKPYENDENDEWDEQPTLEIKAKPKPQTNDQNDEFEKYFGKKKPGKKQQIMPADDEDEDDYNLKSASPKNSKSFKCPDCDLSFKHKSSLTRHLKDKHK